MFEAVVTMTVTKTGERVNARCVVVYPGPGFEVNFTPIDGKYPASGTYQIRGTLQARQGVKDGKPWHFVECSGTALPAEVSIKVAGK